MSSNKSDQVFQERGKIVRDIINVIGKARDRGDISDDQLYDMVDVLSIIPCYVVPILEKEKK